MVQAARVVWSYRDLELMPEDNLRREIVEGELSVTPSPNTFHQTISKRLEFELILQVEKAGQGVVFYAPLDVILSDVCVLEPDLVVIRSSRQSIISERGIEGAPDWVIEILSPSTERIDRERKHKLYAEFGVQEYWLVDPRTKRVEVLTLTPEGFGPARSYGVADAAKAETFAFAMSVAEIFA